MGNVHILLVEDEPIVAMHMRSVLENAGYQIAGVAARCDAALLMAEDRALDLAIVDVALADPIDGISTARELNERFAVPIIFATGYPDQALRQARDISGVILSKPFQDQDLIAAVEECLARHSFAR